MLNNGFDFYFLGNMMSDGSGIIYHAQWFNDAVTYTEIEVEWESATDRDGLTTFAASTDDTSAGFTEISLYAEANGTFNWEYKFLFAGGYSRTIDFVGTENPEYDSVDDWKAFVEEDAGTSGTDTPEEKKRQQDAWIISQRGHAVANGLPVVAVNRVGHEPDPSQQTRGIQFWGHSFVAGPQGEILAEAGTEPCVKVVDVDMKRCEQVRRWWPFLRDRRIDEFDDLLRRYAD